MMKDTLLYKKSVLHLLKQMMYNVFGTPHPFLSFLTNVFIMALEMFFSIKIYPTISPLVPFVFFV